MSRRLVECRSDGCKNEVTFKTIDAYDPQDRRTGAGIRASVGAPDRGSPNGYHRHSTTAAASLYCKQHTCIHFFREEACPNKKPQHDAVCAIHARCPVPHCIQARAQYLDSKFDAVPGAVPRYMRYELCIHHKCIVQQCDAPRASSTSTYCSSHGCQSEGCTSPSQERRNCCEKHQCQVQGCNTIVEGRFPYCVIHVKCDIKGCNMARHLLPRTKEYLRYCETHVTCEVDHCREIKLDYSTYCANHTCHERGCAKSSHAKPYCSEHMCAEPDCEFPRPVPGKHKQKAKEKYCPLHTCREKECHEFVDHLCLFCKDHGCSKPHCLQPVLAETLCINHFKDAYHARGQLAVQRSRRSRSTTNPHYPMPPRDTDPTSSASETFSDDDVDDTDSSSSSSHRRRRHIPPKSLPPPSSTTTTTAAPGKKPSSRHTRFHPAIVSHTTTTPAPRDRDRDREYQRPPRRIAPAGETIVPSSSSSRRHRQQQASSSSPVADKEKAYWPGGGESIASGSRASMDSLVAEQRGGAVGGGGGGGGFKVGNGGGGGGGEGGGGYVNGGGSVGSGSGSGSGSSRTAVGGKRERGIGVEEVMG